MTADDKTEDGPGRSGERWADVYDEEHAFMVPSASQLTFFSDLAGDGRALEFGIGTRRGGAARGSGRRRRWCSASVPSSVATRSPS
jgi:hypothetical protein